MYNSRYLILTVAIACLAVASAIIAMNGSPASPRDVTLVYVGADDCAPCRKWQREDGALLRTSAEFQRMTYREVKSPTLFSLLKDEYWPEDLRPLRNRLGPGAGAPLWLVVADGEVISRHFGAARWQSDVWPQIKSLLR